MKRLASAVLLWLCLLSAAWPATFKDVLIEDVPFIRQKPDFCGEACVAMFLRKLGQDADQDYVFDQSGVDPLLGRGCLTAELKESRTSGTFTAADYARHVRKLKGKVPEGFTMVLEPPFLVLGDEPPERVRARSNGTIRWSVDMLKKDYFTRDPECILDIWLFKDKASYEKHTREIFGDSPSTPFGYYSDEHKALVMNIATGGGTLVHEIVHPFMASNFPDCPAWFNEGMGSLYEQCKEWKGRIHGLTNWRLAGLQKAIRADTVPSFKELTGTSNDEFYNEDKGTNYAQARYLCYYLQQKDLLAKFYHAFVMNGADDPTGYKILQTTLAEEDMDAFKKTWEAWVLKLRFP